MCGLGANKTPAATQRIGKCIGILKAVSDNYDEQTEVARTKDTTQWHQMARIGILFYLMMLRATYLQATGCTGHHSKPSVALLLKKKC